ncbi:MAG: threonine synthase [Methanomassiliicoccales archaeon]|nr:MAG: threonine synthase [Methanomassiliicoccales archaeon]
MDRLVCTKCNEKFSLDEKVWQCKCEGLLDIDFKSPFPVDKIKGRKLTMWRYKEAIPLLDDRNIISFDEGFTPLTDVAFNGKSVLVKQDHLFPTGSYKDRGASVLVSKVRELGVRKVVEDSSGNAGCAIAAYCAKAKIDCEIYVPEDTSAGKLAQIQFYGAKLKKIPGSREDTAHAVLKAAEEYYYASHSWNPFFFHGTKTFAFEVCEQLGWKSPDTVILPVGNGTLLLGAYFGFNELLGAGIIDKIPRIIAIQSVNCAPLYRVFKENLEEIPEIDKKSVLAEGIAIAKPIRGKQIIEAVKKSNGDFIAVDDWEIKESLKDICKKGFYIEPTAASTTAGINNYVRRSNPDETIVSLFTGHGLKTTEKMVKILNE